MKDFLRNIFLHKNITNNSTTTIIDNTANDGIEYTWEYVKSNVLTQKPQIINIDDISHETNGTLQIVAPTTKFESVLIPSKKKKLYVFLSGYNIGDNYPTYSRISWCDKFEGFKLFMDDPTRIEKNFSPSYFFGNKDHNYLEYVKQIINKITSVNKISWKNIVFVASSSCGFASLYLADYFLGSKCIALNPQIDLRLLVGQSFARTMEIDIDDAMYFDRVNVIRFKKNKKSKFFIFWNLTANMDSKQAKLIFKSDTIPTGLTTFGKNIQVLCENIQAVEPHMAQPDEYFVRTVETFMDKKITPLTIQLYDSFVGEMKRFFWRGIEINKLKKQIADSAQ